MILPKERAGARRVNQTPGTRKVARILGKEVLRKTFRKREWCFLDVVATGAVKKVAELAPPRARRRRTRRRKRRRKEKNYFWINWQSRLGSRKRMKNGRWKIPKTKMIS